MEFSSGLALKVLGGLGALSLGSTAIYFANDYFQNSLTKFDQALIDVLKDKDQDITFKVSSSEANDSDLNDSFPNFSADSQTENAKKTSSIFVKVTVDTSDQSKFVVKTGVNSKSSEKIVNGLKELNKNGKTSTSWTWLCEIKLSKASEETINDLADKDVLLKSSPEGFFDILKKNLTADADQSKKETKINFIKNCAWNRGLKENKKINGMSNISENANPLKTTKVFELVKGDANKKVHGKQENQDTTKLYFLDYSEFNNWFFISK